MKGINKREHDTLVKTLQQLMDLLSSKEDSSLAAFVKDLQEVETEIGLLSDIFAEYETLLDQLSHTIEDYKHIHKHLRFGVLAPTLRILRKQIDANEDGFFLLRENLIETKNF